jgi:alpha-methylacyl-CoA racemase
MAERKAFVDVEGVVQPAPAPRFSRDSTSEVSAPAPMGADTDEILGSLGVERDELDTLRTAGTIE